jgi:ribosomal RNA assembly protein
MKYVRIPKERVGVLIGKDGETKKTIERISQVHLEIDSEEGDVAFNEQEAKDPLIP